MSAQGLDVIDQKVQLMHEWINEPRERLDRDISNRKFNSICYVQVYRKSRIN